MQNNFSANSLMSYAIPSGFAFGGFLVSKQNRLNNAIIGGMLGFGLVYYLNRSTETSIMNAYADRGSYKYASGAKPNVSSSGITDLDPILPLPTETVDQPNTVDLLDGGVLLIPPPSDPTFMPPVPIAYGSPPGVFASDSYSATF